MSIRLCHPRRPRARASAATAALLLLAAALPAAAQLERDRPQPPGAPEPPTVHARLARAGAAADHPGAGHLIVLDHAVNHVEPSGVTYIDHYQLLKILTPAGAVQRSALVWPYDPRSSHVEIAEVNLVRDGRRLPVDLAALKDLPAPQAAIYWADRIKTLQLPRLRAGDGVEIVAMRKGYNYALLRDGGDEAPRLAGARERIRGTGDEDDRYIPPMAGEYFDIVVMQADVPIVEKRYELVLPPDKRLISQVYNGPLYARTDYDAQATRYSWWIENVPARPREPRQPGEQDICPKVVMTTAPSWEAKSRWFLDVNRNQFEVTEDIRAHVASVLAEAGLTPRSDPLQVAKALNHWVAQNIRYSGQTMGEGEGFTLHPSHMLFEYRSGVCKDIASMSVTLLRAAGLAAYPAMTMAGSRIEDIPADQFNHCVVAWEQAPGEFVMLDPTWVPFTNDIWSKLETEQQYVIGHPQGMALQEIRYSPPEESPLAVRHTTELRPDGALTGRLRLEGRGALDGRLRSLVAGQPRRGLTPALAALLAQASPRVVVQTVAHRAPDDFTGDMWLEIAYEAPGHALEVGDGLEFKPMAAALLKDHPSLFRAGANDWPAERRTDLLLYHTQRLELVEEIRLPAGYRLASAPLPAGVDETYAAFSAEAELRGRTLRLQARTDIRRRQIPPDGYAGFQKTVAALDDFAATVIRVSKGGS